MMPMSVQRKRTSAVAMPASVKHQSSAQTRVSRRTPTHASWRTPGITHTHTGLGSVRRPLPSGPHESAPAAARESAWDLITHTPSRSGCVAFDMHSARPMGTLLRRRGKWVSIDRARSSSFFPSCFTCLFFDKEHAADSRWQTVGEGVFGHSDIQ